MFRPENFAPVKARATGTVQAAVCAAVEAAGGVKRAAAICGVDESTVYTWSDPLVGKRIPYAQARALTTATGDLAFASDLALLANAIVVRCDAAEAALADLAAKSAEDCARYFAEVIRAVADGDVTDQERDRIRAPLKGAIDALVAAWGKLGEAGK